MAGCGIAKAYFGHSYMYTVSGHCMQVQVQEGGETMPNHKLEKLHSLKDTFYRLLSLKLR